MRSTLVGAWTSPRLFRWTGSLTLAAVTSVILLLIGRRTGFASVYSLDDPYIHLAVAEEILRGNYGVNPDEAASASSSILYPILLTPLLLAGFGQFGPLIIGAAASFCTVLLFGKFIERTFGDHAPRPLMIVSGVLSVLGLNLVGLAFTGMEHSLHVLLTLLALYGLLLFKEDGQVRPWWILTVVVAPFVRFEGLSTVLLIALFLLCQRRVVPAITCVAAVGAGMAIWWFVMNRLELPFLPSSVLTKLDLGAPTTGGIILPLIALARNMDTNLSSRAGLMLFALAATLLLRAPPERFIRSLRNTGPQYVGPSVALFGAVLIVAHLVAGKEGWFLRYEAYVLITGVVCLVSAFYPAITTGRGGWQGAIIASSVLVLLQPYTLATLRTPTAAANVFAQHYQMHRLAADILRVPVGVNDVGWVSFRNDNYVLDFWGLGSEVARKARMAAAATGENDGAWMNNLARGRGVQIAMIYEAYLPAPADWIKVAELQLNMRIITPAHGVVSIFVLDPGLLASVTDGLRRLQVTLPAEASLKILAVR